MGSLGLGVSLVRRVGAVCAVVACSWWAPGRVHAQAAPAGSNSGALTLTAGVDAPSVYVRRGFVQERSPQLTLTPYGDLALALTSGASGRGGLRVHLGTWHSLQTGSSGSAGFTEHLHYAENFYASLAYGLTRSLSVEVAYTAYTSPNFEFNTITESSLKVAHASWLAPYALLAFDLGEHSFDGGTKKGSYLEAGIGPRFHLLGPVHLTVPVKVGASLSHYYEWRGADPRFGFLDAGGVLTLPLSTRAGRLGGWDVHGGVEVYALGDTAKAFNAGKKSKIVASAGLGLSY